MFLDWLDEGRYTVCSSLYPPPGTWRTLHRGSLVYFLIK